MFISNTLLFRLVSIYVFYSKGSQLGGIVRLSYSQTKTAHKPCASKGTSVSTNMATQTGPVAIPDPPVKRSEFSAQMEYMDRALTDHERRMRTAEILRDSQEKKVDKNNAELFMLYSEMRDAHNGMLSDINDLIKVLSDLMMVTPNFENLIVRQGAPTDSSVRASDNINQRRMPDQTCTAMPNTSYANPTPAPIMRPDGFPMMYAMPPPPNIQMSNGDYSPYFVHSGPIATPYPQQLHANQQQQSTTHALYNQPLQTPSQAPVSVVSGNEYSTVNTITQSQHETPTYPQPVLTSNQSNAMYPGPICPVPTPIRRQPPPRNDIVQEQTKADTPTSTQPEQKNLY